MTSINKSVTKLTAQQDEFYRLLRIRATSKKFGQPYIAYAIFRLVPIHAPGLKTMGIDEHFRVYIDFDYMMEKGIEFASMVLNHEPWHPLRKATERAKMIPNIDNYQWNIAHDMEINDDIRDRVPVESMFPQAIKEPEGKTAEYYYDKLQKKKEEQQKKNSKKGKPEDKAEGQDGGPGDPSESGSDGQPGNDGQPGSDGQPGDGKSKKGNKPGNGNPSESGSGLPENEICKTGDGVFEREYKLGKDGAEVVDEFDQELIGQQVAQEIKQQEARNPGSVPAGHKLWADEKLAKTPTPWQKILRGAIKSAVAWQKGKVEYIRSRPNRRQPIPRVILPALMAPKANILIGVDTSGSHVPMLPRVLDEVNSIMASIGIRGKELRVFSIDTEMKEAPKFVNDARKIKLSGGGGTAMRPAFDYSKKDRKNHDIFILFTDGELPPNDYPATQPTSGVRYVICILGWKDDNYSNSAYERAKKEAGAWARVVKIDVPRDEK